MGTWLLIWAGAGLYSLGTAAPVVALVCFAVASLIAYSSPQR